MKKITLASILLTLIPGFCAFATELAWQQPLGEENNWSRVTYAGTLLVASDNQLAHYDPTAGKLLWVRRDLGKLAQFNVRDVSGTPFLVINQQVGTVPPKNRLQVLNISSGESLWDTGVVAGTALGGYPVPDKNLLVVAANLQGGNGTKAGIYLVGVNLSTGEEKWRTRLGSNGSLPVHTSEESGFIPVQDFSGHPQPLITDDTFLLVASNLIAVDINTGVEKWRFKLKASVNNLKRTYAQPLLVDGILYAVSRNSLYAIDFTTGEEVWKAKIGNAAMPQLEMVNNMIVGRMGGSFSNGKDIVQQKPFGAFVVNTTSGKLAWKWTKAKDSLTNLKVLPEQGLIMLADKKKLYALDLNAVKKARVVYDEKLEFKRKMGSADIAAKGIGAVGGFLGGGLAGGFKSLGGGSDRGDPPLDIEIYGDQLIIRAQYHVLAHNISERSTDWSIEFAPPGMSPFALIAMGAVTTAVAVGSAGPTRATGGWQGRSMLNSTLAISNSFEAAVSNRYAAAEKGKNVAFFLTKEEGGMLLIGIDLANGQEVGRIPLSEKEPQFMVDAIGSRVYHFKDKTELLAYDF